MPSAPKSPGAPKRSSGRKSLAKAPRSQASAAANRSRPAASKRKLAKSSAALPKSAGKPRVKTNSRVPTARARGATTSETAFTEPMRIARAMARAGLCSRREADRWIADGRVSVNGLTLTTPAVEVKPSDTILVDGHPLPAAAPVQLWRYHKPKHQVTTNRDPQGRPTVFDNLPKDLPRVMSVGRLDFNTEGLLLLTNDGGLARHLELPATGWLRRYKVRVHGRVAQASLARLADGITIDGIRYGPISAELLSAPGESAAPSSDRLTRSSANTWLTVGLREGKNREVRRIMESLGLTVNRLIRLSYGPFQLLDLPPGHAEPVKPHALAEHLGRDVASMFGLEAKRWDTDTDQISSTQTVRSKKAKRNDRSSADATAQPVRKPRAKSRNTAVRRKRPGAK